MVAVVDVRVNAEYREGTNTVGCRRGGMGGASIRALRVSGVLWLLWFSPSGCGGPSNWTTLSSS